MQIFKCNIWLHHPPSFHPGVIIDDGVIPLPVRFAPKGAGLYPCRVVLRSPNDIRVYQIECTVNPEGTVAQIEFTAPVHQSVSQDIPIVSTVLEFHASCAQFV